MKVKSRKDGRINRGWRYETDQYPGSTLHYRVVAAVWVVSFATIIAFSICYLSRSGMELFDLLFPIPGWCLDALILLLAAFGATVIAALVFVIVGVLLSLREKWREWGRS